MDVQQTKRYSEATLLVILDARAHGTLDWTLKLNCITNDFPNHLRIPGVAAREAGLEQCITRRPKPTSSLSSGARKVVLRNEDH